MICRATLKADWRSPRGRLYPTKTVFILNKRLKDIDSTIYDFSSPGIGRGIVVLSNTIFKQLTKEEKHIQAIRKKEREEHIRKTKDLLLR